MHKDPSRHVMIGALRRMLGQVPGEEEPGACYLPNGEVGVRLEPGGPCVPVYDIPEEPEVGPGGKPLPPDFVAPGPTELHPERWDLDSSPCTYTVAYGDTYVGIAKTYLDPSGLRWREVWEPNRAQHPNPDRIYPGDVIVMPEEACENMRRWLQRGQPGELPSQLEPSVGDKVRAVAPWLLAAAAGVGLYWMS